MATQVQLRRGNTSQTNAFTGVSAEVTVDTDKNTIVIHDGSTAGGFPLAKEAFAQAAFNAANNATDTYVRAHANAAFDHANSAFDTANTNSGSITVLQGVDNTQNTSITTATNTGTAAFIHANAAFDKANTGGATINGLFFTGT